MDIDTDPCYCTAMDPDMVRGSIDWDFTLISGGSTVCSHQTVLFHLASPDHFSS